MKGNLKGNKITCTGPVMSVITKGEEPRVAVTASHTQRLVDTAGTATVLACREFCVPGCSLLGVVSSSTVLRSWLPVAEDRRVPKAVDVVVELRPW